MSKNNANSGGKPVAPHVDPAQPNLQAPTPSQPEPAQPITASPEALAAPAEPTPTVAQTPEQLGQVTKDAPKGDAKDAGPNNDEPVAIVAPGTDPSVAEFVTVKTSGDFNLIDPYTGTVFDANTDGEKALKTTFVVDNLESGRLVEA